MFDIYRSSEIRVIRYCKIIWIYVWFCHVIHKRYIKLQFAFVVFNLEIIFFIKLIRYVLIISNKTLSSGISIHTLNKYFISSTREKIIPFSIENIVWFQKISLQKPNQRMLLFAFQCKNYLFIMKIFFF